jgi:DHA1 family multidrug resistance protein-like MFS transporter
VSIATRSGIRARLARRAAILPVLVAEAILWIGFGALLPVLPLYLTDRGIDPATLGFIVAAWPIARLVSEPAFGWLADRTSRRALMLGGLVAAGLLVALPLVVDGALAFFVARFLVGLGASAYGPAARGYIVDATPPGERGEVFGLYSSAQMGGLFVGPAIGGVGGAIFGGAPFVFVVCAVAALLAAGVLAATTRERVTVRDPASAHGAGTTGLPILPRTSTGGDPATTAMPAAAGDIARDGGSGGPGSVLSLLNRMVVFALLVNAGANVAAGTYDVIWSLWLHGLGADLGLIGFTFAAFGLPVLLVSPFAGRLIDQRGPLVFIVVGSLMAALAGVLYTLVLVPVLSVPIVIFEGVGFAFLIPALFVVVARATPTEQASTAQGLLGAAGEVGFVVASIAAGALFAIDTHLPFYVFAVTMVATLGLGLLVGGAGIRAAGGAERAGGRLPVTASAEDGS